uniref:Uncharacterized protein n=1 Tax=Vitis vinifera TaxID=29760 RepID=F6HC17_VITVI
MDNYLTSIGLGSASMGK